MSEINEPRSKQKRKGALPKYITAISMLAVCLVYTTIVNRDFWDSLSDSPGYFFGILAATFVILLPISATLGFIAWFITQKIQDTKFAFSPFWIGSLVVVAGCLYGGKLYMENVEVVQAAPKYSSSEKSDRGPFRDEAATPFPEYGTPVSEYARPKKESEFDPDRFIAEAAKVKPWDLYKLKLFDGSIEWARRPPYVPDDTLVMKRILGRVENTLSKPLASIDIRVTVFDGDKQVIEKFVFTQIWRKPNSLKVDPLPPGFVRSFSYPKRIERIPKDMSWQWERVGAKYAIE